MISRTMSPTEQFQALNILDVLSDLFSAAGTRTFTCVEVLIILDAIRSDPEFFDPDVVVAQQIATADFNTTVQAS
jgi:hypothetical protein